MGWRLRQLMRAAKRETSVGSSGSGRGGHESRLPAMAARRALASWRRNCSERPSRNCGGRVRARDPPSGSPSPAASGSSIQLCTKSAKQLSPSTKGCRLRPLLSSAAVQSSESSPRQCSRQASGVDLGRGRRVGATLATGVPLGRGRPLVERRCLRRHAGGAGGAGCWGTGSSSSLHVLPDTSEKPESQSKAFSRAPRKVAFLCPVPTAASSSSSTQQTESASNAWEALSRCRSCTPVLGLGGGGRGPGMGGEPESRPHNSSQRSWPKKLSSRVLCMPLPRPRQGAWAPSTPASAAPRGPGGPASGALAQLQARPLLALRGSRGRPNIWQLRPAPGAAANGAWVGQRWPNPSRAGRVGVPTAHSPPAGGGALAGTPEGSGQSLPRRPGRWN